MKDTRSSPDREVMRAVIPDSRNSTCKGPGAGEGKCGGAIWTRARLVGKELERETGLDCGGPSMPLESGFNLKYYGKPLEGSGMV